MQVTLGNLDALVGESGTAAELDAVHLLSYTTSGSGGSLAVQSAQLQITGNQAPFTTSATSFTVSTVDDASNAINVTLYSNGSPSGSQRVYVIAANATTLFLSGYTTSTLAGDLSNGFDPDGVIGVVAIPQPTVGATVSVTANGVFTGSNPQQTQNIIYTLDGISVSPAVTGLFNQEIITAQAPNAVLYVASGYQSASIAGSNAATLIDTQGTVDLAGGGGNATLISAASADTLQAGSGNDVLVAFSSGAFETAAGESSNNLFFGGSSPVTVQGGSGHDTVVLTSGGVVTTGTGGSQVWLSTGSTVVDSAGADTIVGGSGAVTVNVLGSNPVLDFAGSGSLVFNGGSGASTVVGVAASVTVNGGAGGGTFFGGTQGSNVINSGSGAAIMVGGGNGDVLTATGTANDVLQASGGAETLNAAGSSGNDAFFGGAGSDCIIGGTGNNAFTAGPGNMTLIGGGSDLYIFLAGASSTTMIQNFNAGHDYIKLSGFASGAVQSVLNGATSSGGGTLLTLSDGTKITLAGITPNGLSSSNFV